MIGRMDMRPMLAAAGTLADLDRGDGWCAETKQDGHRAVAVVTDRDVALWSRQLNRRSEPRIERVLSALLPCDAVLDGEIHIRNGRLPDLLARRGEVVYTIFDCLYLDGYDITSLPLFRRRSLLELVIAEDPDLPVQLVEQVDGPHMRALFERVCNAGMEGCVAKLKEGRYHQGQRMAIWRKVKP